MSAPAQQGEEAQQLIRRIGRALLATAPPRWRQLRAEYRSAGRHIEADVFVTGEDGATRPVRPPMEVVELLGQLRGAMYQPGRGTWLSGVYLLDHPSKFSAEFEPDVEPAWRRVPPHPGVVAAARRPATGGRPGAHSARRYPGSAVLSCPDGAHGCPCTGL
jgi:hypothetical protein